MGSNLPIIAKENILAVKSNLWTNIVKLPRFSKPSSLHQTQEAATAGTKLCGGGLLAPSISSSIGALIDGDESAAIFKKDVGEQMVRPLTPGSAKRDK